MAYTRRKRGRRTYGRRRMTRKVRKARKVARIGTVKRMISRNEETKWAPYDFLFNTAYDVNTDKLLMMSNNAQGVARSERLGNKITITKFQFFISSAAANGIFSRLRFIMFIDKQARATPPVPSDLLQGQGTIMTANSVQQVLNPNTVPSRYQILLDRFFTVGIEGGSTNVSQETIKRYTVRKKITIQYTDGGGSGQAVVQDKVVYGMVISDEVVGSQPSARITGIFYFKDA